MIEINSGAGYNKPSIMVLGVGGGGNNALNRMIQSDEYPVNYVAVNTDKMVLDNSLAGQKLAIGEILTGGYGAGGDPEVGMASAEENRSDIENLVRGSQMVIIAGGMGGGTGTGAIPVIAGICREQKVLTVAIVTKPFSFEGRRKMELAEAGINRLREVVDTLLVIPNDKLILLGDRSLDLDSAFLTADSVLQNTITAITNIICNCGVINLDFNDLRTVLKGKGEGHLGISSPSANDDIIKAVDSAIHSPLLDTDLFGAENLLINCSGKVNLIQLNEALVKVREAVGEDAYITWGTVEDKRADGISVTVIATGLNSHGSGQQQGSRAMAPERKGIAAPWNLDFGRGKRSSEAGTPVESPFSGKVSGAGEKEKGRQRQEIVIPEFISRYGK